MAAQILVLMRLWEQVLSPSSKTSLTRKTRPSLGVLPWCKLSVI
jgi:hypothetical protein